MVSGELKAAACQIRWTQPESWHITLQFLGNVTPAQLPSLGTHLEEIRSPAIRIRMGGIEVFDRAGVLFVGVEVSEKLAALQRKVTLATGACGFVAETRPYHPHITLARAKDRSSMHQLRGVVAGKSSQTALSSFDANEFRLYESFPGGDCSRYEIRARFPLGR